MLAKIRELSKVKKLNEWQALQIGLGTSPAMFRHANSRAGVTRSDGGAVCEVVVTIAAAMKVRAGWRSAIFRCALITRHNQLGCSTRGKGS